MAEATEPALQSGPARDGGADGDADVTVLTSRLDETIEEWRREAVAGVHAEGVARQRAMLCRLAERRFGSETGADLARLLADVSDPERLELIGDAIIDCESGDALIAAVSR